MEGIKENLDPKLKAKKVKSICSFIERNQCEDLTRSRLVVSGLKSGYERYRWREKDGGRGGGIFCPTLQKPRTGYLDLTQQKSNIKLRTKIMYAS